MEQLVNGSISMTPLLHVEDVHALVSGICIICIRQQAIYSGFCFKLGLTHLSQASLEVPN